MNRYLIMVITFLAAALCALMAMLFFRFQECNERNWELSALQGEEANLRRELDAFVPARKDAGEMQLTSEAVSLERELDALKQQLSQEEMLYQAALSDQEELEAAIREAEIALEEKKSEERRLEEEMRRASEAAASSSSRASESSLAQSSSSQSAVQASSSSAAASSEKGSQIVVNSQSSEEASSSSKISVIAIPRQSDASGGSSR